MVGNSINVTFFGFCRFAMRDLQIYNLGNGASVTLKAKDPETDN